jgi:peptidoglycan/LPS O-acetylase OafA/YrhL
VRRAFRILPAALVYLGVIVLVAATGAIVVSPREVLGSLFFFRNYLGPEAGFYTTHYWSLSVEEQFYIVWPTLLIVLLGFRRPWPVLWTIAMAVLVACWRQVSVMHDLSHYGHLDPGFFLRTGVRADGLLLGAAMALALRVNAKWLEATPLWAWIGLAITYVAVVLHFGLRATIWEASLVPVLIAWTTYHPSSVPSRVLEAPAIRWLGRLSYSLYLWQQPFFPPRGIAVGLPVAWKWPLEVAAALACGVASFYLIERPAIRVGHRLAPPVTPGRGDIGEPATAGGRRRSGAVLVAPSGL